jgi:Na+-translocating ferredoxin:NAD+ oxidoreductase subunit E
MRKVSWMGNLGLEFIKGIWKENPIFRIVVGMCPTLAVTTAAVNGLAMGLSTLFVLLASGVIIALIRKLIPDKVRIPLFVIIISTFVTIADQIIAAFFPPIYKVLGLYIPLIVVNCIILARIEAFSSKNPVMESFMDALGMGLGFTWTLILLASIRELLSAGTIFGLSILSPTWYNPMIVFQTSAGAFLTLGLLIGWVNMVSTRKAVTCHAFEPEKKGEN